MTAARKKVVDIAKSWLGYNEGDGTHKKILEIYNAHKPLARGYKMKPTDDWCACFVSAVAIKAGFTDIMPTEVGCGKMIDLYKKLGCWKESDSYKPAPGDVIFYDWEDNGVGDNKGTPNHVGIVVSVTGNTISIIEGNKSNAVAYRKIPVNGKYIRGYGLPNYKTKAVNKKPTTEPAKYLDKEYSRTYTVNASALNMRRGAGTNKDVIKVLKRGDKVRCYGYYSKVGTARWMYVVASDGTVGYCHKNYLV